MTMYSTVQYPEEMYVVFISVLKQSMQKPFRLTPKGSKFHQILNKKLHLEALALYFETNIHLYD